jgi:regulator of cell morphogenesis and NO signaling
MDTTQRTDFQGRPVGEVVADDYRRAAVFKRYGIDFCCSGGRTVQAACDKKGVSYPELEAALLEVSESRDGAGDPDPREWGIDFLADHISSVHHAYVRKNLPILQAFARKVARVHGAQQPEVVEIAGLLDELAPELEQHMAKEEEILFPHVRALAAETQAALPGGKPGTASEPDSSGEAMRLMEEEHDHAGDILRRIRALSSDYQPPEWACNTYRATYVMLEEFEADLHRHVHLENNVLFPRTAALERSLAERSG